MITTLSVLAIVCLLSLAFILVISYFAATKAIVQFLPQDIQEAAKVHSDPPVGKRVIGYLLTALALAGYGGALFFLGADGLRRGYGFWLLFGRYMLFLYGYKLFDILVQDQYVVITKKYPPRSGICRCGIRCCPCCWAAWRCFSLPLVIWRWWTGCGPSRSPAHC